MRKYKQIILLAIFGVANLCYLSDALSVEKYLASTNEDEMEIMLRTLEKERAELGKLKSEFKGVFQVTEDVTEVPAKKEVEKEKVLLAHFVKKSADKSKMFIDVKNGEDNKVIILENDSEYMKKSEKVAVNDEEEIIHPFEIAENLYKLGEYQTALDIYQLVIKNDLTNEKKMWVSYQIANCYRKLSSYNEAVEAYNEIQKVYEGTYWAKQAQWHIEDIVWRTKAEKKLEKVIER
ncbi:MAG: tetratricopeptide repeat protein [Candidatus Brocadiales bacterium]|nr:tetratricopeptide repeat protein [Candidatus Brocadiales bacterium]